MNLNSLKFSNKFFFLLITASFHICNNICLTWQCSRLCTTTLCSGSVVVCGSVVVAVCSV